MEIEASEYSHEESQRKNNKPKLKVMNNTNIHKVGVRRKSSVVLSLLLGSATLVLSTLTSSAGATQFTVPFDVTVAVPGLVAGGFGECPEINYPLHLNGVSHLVIKD